MDIDGYPGVFNAISDFIINHLYFASLLHIHIHFQEKKIDYEKALDKYEKDKNAAFKKYLDDKEKDWNDFKPEDLKKAQDEYFRCVLPLPILHLTPPPPPSPPLPPLPPLLLLLLLLLPLILLLLLLLLLLFTPHPTRIDV